jgi:hypothetical protein
MADPNQSLMIFTNSEYTICHACYWAGKNSQIGRAMPNGNPLKDLVYLLAKRRTPTCFVRIERSAKNARADAVWKLAQAGLKTSAAPEKYSRIEECPCSYSYSFRELIDTPKISMALPEKAEAKPAKWKNQPDEEDILQGDPEDHRGPEKVRQLQKSLRDKLFECKDAGAFW